MITKEILKAKVLKVAAENPEGWTFDLKTGKQKTEGAWMVALKETQNSFNVEGLEKALDVALERGCYIGGWLGDYEGPGKRIKVVYFDAVVEVEDFEQAVQMARENDQLAIFHFEKGCYDL